MSTFAFKHFSITQENTTMKVGTDAMILGALIDVQGKQKGFEIGLGTGVISLMLAQRNPEIILDGIEIDEAAFQEARMNFIDSPWSNRLTAYHADLLEIATAKKYDLIFSNPPYYQKSLVNVDDRKARARHEVFLPLEKLVDKAASLLTPGGDFWIIVPAKNAYNWISCCKRFDLNLTQKIHVTGKLGGAVKRMILHFSQLPKILQESELTIRDSENRYTVEYIELTKEYHAIDLSVN